jgi:hypothetical protein
MNPEPLPAGNSHRLASTRIGSRETRLERPRRAAIDSPAFCAQFWLDFVAAIVARRHQALDAAGVAPP